MCKYSMHCVDSEDNRVGECVKFGAALSSLQRYHSDRLCCRKNSYGNRATREGYCYRYSLRIYSKVANTVYLYSNFTKACRTIRVFRLGRNNSKQTVKLAVYDIIKYTIRICVYTFFKYNVIISLSKIVFMHAFC